MEQTISRIIDEKLNKRVKVLWSVIINNMKVETTETEKCFRHKIGRDIDQKIIEARNILVISRYTEIVKRVSEKEHT